MISISGIGNEGDRRRVAMAMKREFGAADAEVTHGDASAPITVAGVDGDHSRRKVADAITTVLGTVGVCMGRAPIAPHSSDCAKWVGGDRCRKCAIENYFKFED